MKKNIEKYLKAFLDELKIWNEEIKNSSGLKTIGI